MRLNDVINSVLHNNTAVTSNNSVAQMSNANIAAQIRALTPGQILQGEVLENVGDAVKLLVHMNGEDVTLQARLEQSIALSAGKNLLFQVKNNGSTLSLSPLLENMAMGESAAKALESASLPLNDNTLHMTTTLMQEGMSISKESLQGIYQEMLSNQNAELMDIIDLHKLNMPVNSDNLAQIHSYKEMTHQLTGSVEQLTQDMTHLVSDMARNGQGKEISQLLQNIFHLSEAEGTVTNSSLASENLATDNVATLENAMTDKVTGQGNTPVQDTSGQGTPNVQGNVSEQPMLENTPTGTVPGNGEQANASQPALQTNELINDLQKLLQQLELAGGDREALSKLIENDVFKDNLSEFLQKQMLLEPEAVADKEKVQEFFGKLSKQLSQVSEALSMVGQEQSAAAKTVTNMSQNVNFLNQMNQMYAYIQLPFKLSESNAHGELYVYSNKKNLASKDGEVSALLHLDMENLGPVDVYVKMKEQNVSTRFYLQDDEMITFIHEHIDILNERLEKRGYHMSCSMTVRNEPEEGKENVTLQELLKENSNIPMMVNYSFDVRA